MEADEKVQIRMRKCVHDAHSRRSGAVSAAIYLVTADAEVQAGMKKACSVKGK